MVTIIKHILDKYFKNNLNPTLKDCKDYVESIDKNEFLKYASSSYVKQFVKEKRCTPSARIIVKSLKML